MNRAHIVSALAVTVVLAHVAACIAGGGFPTPSAADAEASGSSLEALQTGRRVYLEKCSDCHALVPPRKFTRDEWPSWVDSMAERSDLSAEEHAAVLQYVMAYAKP